MQNTRMRQGALCHRPIEAEAETYLKKRIANDEAVLVGRRAIRPNTC
jgi:hypothetical protein